MVAQDVGEMEQEVDRKYAAFFSAGVAVYQSQLRQGVQFDLAVFVLHRQLIVNLWQLQVTQT